MLEYLNPDLMTINFTQFKTARINKDEYSPHHHFDFLSIHRKIPSIPNLK